MDTKRISELLKSLRKAKGYTQQQVADLLYISPKTISKWESGDGIPDISLMSGVADIYDVTVDEILRGKKGLDKQTKTTITQHKKIASAVKVSMIKRMNNFIYIGLALHVVLLITAIIVMIAGNHFFLGTTIWIIGILVDLLVLYFGYKDYKNSIQFEEEVSILEAHKDVKMHIQKNTYIGVVISIVSLCILGVFLGMTIESTISVVPLMGSLAILYPVIVLWKYINETDALKKQQIIKNTVFILNGYFIFLIAGFGFGFHITDQFSMGYYPLYVSMALPYVAPNLFRNIFLISVVVYIVYVMVSYISLKFRNILLLVGILLIASALLIHFDLRNISHTSYYGVIPYTNIVFWVSGLIILKIFSSNKIKSNFEK